MKPVFLVIIGPSGGGKGTQGKLLAKKFGWCHISVGQLLRQEMAKGTVLGKRVAQFVKEGRWAPTELVMAVLKPVISRSLKKGFVLDGCPRLIDQAKALDEFLAKKGVALDLVIHLRVRPAVIMARRRKAWKEGRSFYPGENRPDESLRAIKLRLKNYQETIKPILSYYQKKGILVPVDGERAIEEIHQEIVGLIKEVIEKKKKGER